MSRAPAFKEAKEMLNDIRKENWKTLGQLIRTDMPKKIMELDRMWKSWATTKDRILNCETDVKESPSCTVINNKRAKYSSTTESTTSFVHDNVDLPSSNKLSSKTSVVSQSSSSNEINSPIAKKCLSISSTQSSEKTESPATEKITESSSQQQTDFEECSLEVDSVLSLKRKRTASEAEDSIKEELPWEDKIKELNKTLRLEINDIVTHLDQLRMCICLTRPKLQDGHNFGVKVQLQVRRILQGGISASITYLDTISNNHMLAAKIREKIEKYPNIQDYRLALREQRSKVLLNQIYCLRALRDTYTVCHDTVVKNMERLRVPRPGGDAWMVSY